MEWPLPHGLTHGLAGVDPLQNGAVITQTFNATNTGDAKFSLSPRSELAFPVPTLRPEGASANYNLALDLMPKGTPGDFGTNGVTWIDLCDLDVLLASTGNFNAARFAIHTDHIELGSRKFGTNTSRPIYLGVDMGGSSATAQIRMSTGLVIVGGDGGSGVSSSILLGNGIVLANSTTVGMVELPSMAGTPTGAYSNHGVNVPVVIDTTASKLWARIGGTWKSVTFA